MIKPRALVPGDKVALITPAGPVDEERMQKAEEIIRRLGLIPVRGAHVLKKRGYLAGTDEERLIDLDWAMRDPEVEGVFALRGGYGTTRLLARVDSIGWLPKVVVGYSDLTALHLYLYRLGLVSFHGPMPASGIWEAYTYGQFQKVLTVKHPLGALPLSQKPISLRDGVAEGRLLGGNLTLLSDAIGTAWEPQINGHILLMEEVSEPPYAVDRHLQKLKNAGLLQRAAGILLGEMVDCQPESKEGDLTLQEVLEDHLLPLNVPILSSLPFGHGIDRATLPLGVKVQMNATDGQVIFLEGALQ